MSDLIVVVFSHNDNKNDSIFYVQHMLVWILIMVRQKVKNTFTVLPLVDEWYLRQKAEAEIRVMWQVWDLEMHCFYFRS